MLVTSDIDFQFANITHALISLNISPADRETERQTPTPWNIDGNQVAVRAIAVRDLGYGGWSERMLKDIRGIQTVGMRGLLLSSFSASVIIAFSYLRQGLNASIALGFEL